jgi:prepilin-type processing-associated H-X9-DG protein
MSELNFRRLLFHRARSRRAFLPAITGFTLVELLVVIGVIALLIALLIPALTKARQVALRTKCLSNMRQLAIGQAMYAVYNHNALVDASDQGEFDITQGSWIGALQPYSAIPIARRCPADRSIYFDVPLTEAGVSAYRTCSYAINNYVSPTHFPTGMTPYMKMTQVPHSSAVIQFVELTEVGNNALADHVHVDEFYNSGIPRLTINNIASEMGLGCHDGLVKSWATVLNYSFLDGHAESLRLLDVYTDPSHNKFVPR